MTFVAKKRPGQACDPWPNSSESGLYFGNGGKGLEDVILFSFFFLPLLTKRLEGELFTLLGWVMMGLGAYPVATLRYLVSLPVSCRNFAHRKPSKSRVRVWGSASGSMDGTHTYEPVGRMVPSFRVKGDITLRYMDTANNS